MRVAKLRTRKERRKVTKAFGFEELRIGEEAVLITNLVYGLEKGVGLRRYVLAE